MGDLGLWKLEGEEEELEREPEDVEVGELRD